MRKERKGKKEEQRGEIEERLQGRRGKGGYKKQNSERGRKENGEAKEEKRIRESRLVIKAEKLLWRRGDGRDEGES